MQRPGTRSGTASPPSSPRLSDNQNQVATTVRVKYCTQLSFSPSSTYPHRDRGVLVASHRTILHFSSVPPGTLRFCASMMALTVTPRITRLSACLAVTFMAYAINKCSIIANFAGRFLRLHCSSLVRFPFPSRWHDDPQRPKHRGRGPYPVGRGDPILNSRMAGFRAIRFHQYVQCFRAGLF